MSFLVTSLNSAVLFKMVRNEKKHKGSDVRETHTTARSVHFERFCVPLCCFELLHCRFEKVWKTILRKEKLLCGKLIQPALIELQQISDAQSAGSGRIKTWLNLFLFVKKKKKKIFPARKFFLCLEVLRWNIRTKFYREDLKQRPYDKRADT